MPIAYESGRSVMLHGPCGTSWMAVSDTLTRVASNGPATPGRLCCSPWVSLQCSNSLTAVQMFRLRPDIGGFDLGQSCV